MTESEFREKVQDFANLIEWVDGHSITYDFVGYPTADILIDGGDMVWKIPVSVDPEDSDEICIDCGNDHVLPADTENAYGYLWCEAMNKVREMAKETKNYTEHH